MRAITVRAPAGSADALEAPVEENGLELRRRSQRRAGAQRLLQGSACWSPDSFAEGCGAGGLAIEGAQAVLGEASVLLPRSYGASLLAWPMAP